MPKTANHTAADHCDACADTGWCILNTQTTIRGIRYPDGCAPCRWCELGAVRYATAQKTSRLEPLSHYPADAVEPQIADANYRPVSHAEAGRRLADLTTRYNTATRQMEAA